MTVKAHSWDADDPRDPVIVVMPDNSIHMAVMPPEDVPSQASGSPRETATPHTSVLRRLRPPRLLACFSAPGEATAGPSRGVIVEDASSSSDGEHGTVSADGATWRAYRSRRFPRSPRAPLDVNPRVAEWRRTNAPRDAHASAPLPHVDLELLWASPDGSPVRPRRARALNSRTQTRPRSLSAVQRAAEALDVVRLDPRGAAAASRRLIGRRHRHLLRSDRTSHRAASMPGKGWRVWNTSLQKIVTTPTLP